MSASSWGGGGLNGFIRRWRATDNALEGIALTHSDTFLALDEMAEVEPKAAYRATYMLANGQGKARAGRGGELRAAAEWRVFFLSTGEISLADKVAEEGRKTMAGQQVRIVDLAADAGEGLGVFEDLHGYEKPERFADAIVEASARHYGHASCEFLCRLTAEIDATREIARAFIAKFTAQVCPPGSDGQVHRVAKRFGLVGAAGEIAIAWGILPWPKGTAKNAAEGLFSEWLKGRGTTGALETESAIVQIRAQLELHRGRHVLHHGRNRARR